MAKSVVIIVMIACFGSLIAQPQARRGGPQQPGERRGTQQRGERRGAPQSATAERIQTRTYLFKETNELKMTHEYYEIPGGAHRDAIIAGASRVFAFFDKHPAR